MGLIREQANPHSPQIVTPDPAVQGDSGLWLTTTRRPQAACTSPSRFPAQVAILQLINEQRRSQWPTA